MGIMRPVEVSAPRRTLVQDRLTRLKEAYIPKEEDRDAIDRSLSNGFEDALEKINAQQDRGLDQLGTLSKKDWLGMKKLLGELVDIFISALQVCQSPADSWSGGMQGPLGFSLDVGSDMSGDTLSQSWISGSSTVTARSDALASTVKKDGSFDLSSFDRSSLKTHQYTGATTDNHTSFEMSAILKSLNCFGRCFR
jgi:hypothetical protein